MYIECVYRSQASLRSKLCNYYHSPTTYFTNLQTIPKKIQLKIQFLSQLYFIKLCIHAIICFHKVKVFPKGLKHSFIY
jgi:hypothetical protein